MAALGCTASIMSWAAKSEQNGQVREHDGGATHVIGLALHDDVPADMQALTGAWQHQHHMHALVTAPKIAIWQLGRYNEDASKCMKQVSCNHLIYLPEMHIGLGTRRVSQASPAQCSGNLSMRNMQPPGCPSSLSQALACCGRKV